MHGLDPPSADRDRRRYLDSERGREFIHSRKGRIAVYLVAASLLFGAVELLVGADRYNRTNQHAVHYVESGLHAPADPSN